MGSECENPQPGKGSGALECLGADGVAVVREPASGPIVESVLAATAALADVGARRTEGVDNAKVLPARGPRACLATTVTAPAP